MRMGLGGVEIMSYKSQAEETAEAVQTLLGKESDSEKAEEIAKIIEKAIIESARVAHESCAKMVVDCCPEDRDIAHKINDRIHKKRDALIANLHSLR
jgi:hypothetical protein